MVTGSFLFLCIIITSYNSSYNAKDHTDSTKTAVISTSETGKDNIAATPAYTLREYQKKVAVFKGSSDTPIYISEVYISELPENDRELLKNGIAAQNKKELDRLVEDYCS